jgi:hypothetical protein
MKMPVGQTFHSPVNSAYKCLAQALPPFCDQPPRAVTPMLAASLRAGIPLGRGVNWRTGSTLLLSGFPAFVLF